MRILIVVLALGLFLSLGRPYAGLAQSANSQTVTDSPPDLPIFSAEVELVNISVVALGKNNKPLPKLNKQNFKVKERKINERIFHEREFSLDLPEQLPHRGGIIIDTSGSTAEQFRYQLDVASEIAKWIIKSISDKKRGDKFFVAEFYYEALDQNPAAGLFTLKQDWTDDINSLVAAIVRKTKKAAGTSPLFGSVRMATEKFKNQPDSGFANFLIVISDGQNNMPFSGLKDSSYFAQSANLPVYTIGTVNHQRVDPTMVSDFENNLKQISGLTGGRFFDIPSQKKLPDIANQILLDLKNQYRLSYKLSADYKSGDEIRVVIEVGSTDVNNKWRQIPAKLLHRGSYRIVKNN